MLGSALVRDPKFQDRVVAETRALLSTIPGSTELTNNWQSLGHSRASVRRGERHEPSTTPAARKCRSIDRQPPLLPAVLFCDRAMMKG